MSPLEEALQERQTLENKGYTDDQMQTAALMIIAAELPNVTFELGQMREQLIALEMSTRGNN